MTLKSLNKSVCRVCKNTFDLSNEQISFVSAMQDKAIKFIMIACPCCGTGTQYKAPCATESPIDTEKQSIPPLRCPISHCSGWVSYVEDEQSHKPFWGCGACGSIWFKRSSLEDDIRAIIERFPYRSKSYLIQDNGFIEANKKDIPNYENIVESEPNDIHNNFLRD